MAAGIMKIFSFAQHALPSMHGYYEIVFLHGLKRRGADIYYYACPGLEICDRAVAPTYKPDCEYCIRESYRVAGQAQMQLRRMDPFMRPQDDAMILDWIESLDPGQYREAQFGSFEIGKWTFSSFNTSVNAPSYRHEDSTHRFVYMRFLAAGLRLCLYISRIIEEFTMADRTLLYNGRMSISNIPRMIALRKGMTVYLHERAAYGQRVMHKNGPLYDVKRLLNQWQAWSEIPLTSLELQQTKEYLLGRARGDRTALNWVAHTAEQKHNLDAIVKRLDISLDKKIWVLFTSSTDELEGQESYDKRGFESQHQWLMMVIMLVRNFPDTQLIIRIHPNIGNKHDDWERRFYRQLIKKQYPHVIVVAHDDPISTYDLMILADAGLAYVSTCGVEMAARAKPVLLGGASPYESVAGIISGDTPEKLKNGLKALHALSKGHENLHLCRSAYRYFNWRINHQGKMIASIKPINFESVELVYSSLDDFAPGKDPALDYFCDTVFQGKDPAIYPSENEKLTTKAAENNFLHKALYRI